MVLLAMFWFDYVVGEFVDIEVPLVGEFVALMDCIGRSGENWA